MKTLKNKMGLMGLAVLGMLPVGCNNTYRGSYEGHPVEINENQVAGNRSLVIYNKGKDNGERLQAVDNNRDGRYDTIDLTKVNRGSVLEDLANIKIIQLIDKQIRGVQDNKTSSTLKVEKE